MRTSLLLLSLLLALSVRSQDRITIARAAMGTPWSITVVATDTLQARRAIDSAYARIENIEQLMSDYRNDSEINRLVRQPPRRWHRVSADLHRVLTFSRRLARITDGAFDPTIGPLTKLWRRAFRQQRLPDPTSIIRARSRVQWKWVRLRRAGRVRLARADMQLDLGGVAKGYALDAAGAVLEDAGLSVYLIDGGGDLLLGDPPRSQTGWQVLTPSGVVDTSRVAIATSGARFRYLEQDGRRYSHIIDPRTGYGLQDPRAVTVIASDGMSADGLASALSVLGPEGAAGLKRAFPPMVSYWSPE
ncbi:FAD:protein FMN transferase [Neolewinella litorea]|uniref:FAD:protein FMN transferase n=1 Tax=Neolewinella litorea TaxID=2562452 RepID=A0A4S4NJN9_9BACT|nr:FAD:protein FMN transferase [Neolewinella litorea]THH40024.1 FAD:protein FMN transferase [Neolewinella litorea]